MCFLSEPEPEPLRSGSHCCYAADLGSGPDSSLTSTWTLPEGDVLRFLQIEKNKNRHVSRRRPHPVSLSPLWWTKQDDTNNNQSCSLNVASRSDSRWPPQPADFSAPWTEHESVWLVLSWTLDWQQLKSFSTRSPGATRKKPQINQLLLYKLFEAKKSKWLLWLNRFKMAAKANDPQIQESLQLEQHDVPFRDVGGNLNQGVT